MRTKTERLEERNARLNDELNNVIDQKDALEAELAKAKEELSTLVAWIAGDGPDALTVLQKLYLSGDEPTLNRIRAAASALPYEKAKPAATTVTISFYDRVRKARLEADAKLIADAKLAGLKVIEHQPEPDAPAPPPDAA